jgi:hypothetical protein
VCVCCESSRGVVSSAAFPFGWFTPWITRLGRGSSRRPPAGVAGTGRVSRSHAQHAAAAHLTQERSGHQGKIVRRQIWAAPAIGIDSPGSAHVLRIRRGPSTTAGNRLSKEVVHGLTSLTSAQATPETLAAQYGGGMENKIHWVRDVVYREDHQHAYTGTGAQAMATRRNLALGPPRLA